MVDEQTLVVGLLSDTGLEQEIRVLQDMQALGAHTLALLQDTNALRDPKPDYIVELDSGLGEWERGALYLPVLQRLAFHRAIAKGLSPDKPHNLKAVIEL
jgi:glucosamine--fructose-6-phosphate aminotransferase (isomerizing)